VFWQNTNSMKIKIGTRYLIITEYNNYPTNKKPRHCGALA